MAPSSMESFLQDTAYNAQNLRRSRAGAELESSLKIIVNADAACKELSQSAANGEVRCLLLSKLYSEPPEEELILIEK